MECLISVAAKIAEFTVEPIGRQVGYLLCYKNNLKELKVQADELQTKKERINVDVEAEERNGRRIYPDVIRWREGVIQSLEEVEKLCEDKRHATVLCWKWSFPNLKSRHQLGRKAKKMTNTIVEMKDEKFDKVGYDEPLDIINNFFTTRGIEELQSRNSTKKVVVLSVKDPKVSRIGVYGMGGVGKTTLVKQVSKQVKDDKLFDTVVMVTVSQTNLKRIQDEIAEQLGFHFLKETTSLIGRANRLCERIKQEKTILIILDDLQEKIDLEEIGIPSLDTWGKMNPEKVGVPLKDDYKSCKLLMISRTEDILHQNDVQKNNIFNLDILNGEESWSLFEAMVGDVVKDDNFQKIAIQVAKRCLGLPVLIVPIAKSLKYNEDIHYWKDTLNTLKGVDNRDINKTLFSTLEFSFNRLEDEVKKVFLLCGVHGISILVSDLLKYAIGLGIFTCINTIEHARNRLYRIIIDLKASCLLVNEDARLEMIKMHAIHHEVAASMASKYAFTKSTAKLQDWPRKDILERCTYIILAYCYIQKLPERLDCPHLTFLSIDSFANRSLKIPDSFFEGAGNLKALDLTGMVMSSLPKSLNSLTKLKTLCLDHCSLEDMTVIGVLINLEILSLIHSSMEKFPSEIVKLTKLKMLDLSRSRIGAALPDDILHELTNLEELYMGDATIKWTPEISTTRKRNAILANDLTGLTALEIQIREASLFPKDISFEKLERYRVVIGDKWKWSDNKETSRLLKLKLDTNIHCEGWIKTLIKRVEDLYLDKISGISNVLFELNGEGFPLLRYLHIQNNGEIQHIVNSMEGNQTHVVFPQLETMILHNLNNLVKICHGSVRDNSFGKLKVVEVRSCDQLVYLFSISMVKAFSQLVEIKVSDCISMKNIMSVESTDSGKTMDAKIEFLPLRSLTLQHLPTIEYFCSHELSSSQGAMENLLRDNIAAPFFSAKVKFSNLETLKLSSVNLKKIWDDSSAPYLIHNLANLIVEDCSGLKYLFSSSMVRWLSNLKQLKLSKCDMMEEIIATEEINGVAVGEMLFPKLKRILIKDMQNLKTIWHFILASNSLACLKTLEVKNCDKIEKIFPEYMKGTFATLETLKVEDCESLQEIFQLGDNADDKPQLKYITLLRLPQLKQVWSRDPQSRNCFKSLQVVRVEDCGRLEYLFPFSIAGHLPQLEAITIKNAEKMKEIVSKREEPLDNVANFEFDKLTSIVLCNLQDLQGFCARNHNLSCSSLKIVDIFNCKKLKLFRTQVTGGQRRLADNNLHFSIQQPLFILEEVIGNLEELTLSIDDVRIIQQGQYSGEQFSKLRVLLLAKFEDDQTTFPCWFLQNMTGLEQLNVEWSSFKEIFHEKARLNMEGKMENKTRIKVLNLIGLHELKHICKEGCELDPVLEVLEYLAVDQCSSLKHLVPSSVTFSHMTYLEVTNCRGLIYLITSSTATSLVKLTTLKIRECDSIEEIVAEKEGESINEIAFNSLEVLELNSLSKLQVFCSSNCLLKLPVLESLVIRQCPRMTSFAAREANAPLLQKVLSDEQNGMWCWEDDLTRTINKMFQDMVGFSSFDHLEFSEYPELKEIWYGQFGQKIFCNLKCLVVRKCTFLSNVIVSSNLLQLLFTLEELEVAECDSLKAIFDVKALDDKVMGSKEVSGLKKLILSGLPNLKHIWNREAGEIISFENLQILIVDECQQLKNLFSVPLCQDLRQLKELSIVSCGVKEIVSIAEGLEELKFDFPMLTALELFNLTQLTNFYPKRCTLVCPSLKILNVCGCEELQIFAFDHLNSQLLREGDIELQTKQALFYIEEVCQKLEELSMNEKDSMRILNENYDKKLFHSIEILRLQHFQETPMKFLNDYIQIFPSMTTLQARCSSFETLFPLEEIVHCSVESPAQVKTLWLSQLEQLKHIWSNDDDSASYPLLQNLQNLSIVECSGIIRLTPPSASFKNLTSLEVEECNGLIYFMTSCTAKSLIHLTSLTVGNCGMLEEVVMTDEGESEEVITLESLKYLELTYLSGFKSFCSGKYTFIFPSLVTLKVIGCPRMQYFSSEIIIAPFLKSVEVENEKKRWREDLNTTIKQIFIDKANEGGVESDCKESSSINIDNNQTHQKTVITSRALSSDESKAHEIVDSGKQGIYKLPTPHTGIGTQETCEITEALDQASQNTSEFTKVDAVIETREMHEITEGDFIQDAPTKFSFTIVRDAANRTDKMNETIQTPYFETVESTSTHTSVQETDETIQRHLGQATHQGTLSPSIVLRDTECTPDGSQYWQLRLNEDLLVQATTSIKNDNEDNTGTEEMHETLQGLLDQNAEDMLIPISVKDIATEIPVTHESIHKPFVQATQNAWDITIVQKKEETSHDSDIHLSKNLFHQTITSVALDPDYKRTVGTREMYQFKGSFLVHDAPNILSPNMLYDSETKEATEKTLIQTTQEAHSCATIQDIATGTQEIHDAIQTDQDTESPATTRGTQEMCDTIKKPSILVAQNASISSTMIPNAATIYQSLSQAPELVTAQNTEESYKAYIETQEKWDNVKKPSSPTAQDIRNSTMLLVAEAIDQSPSKAPKPMTSSILESSAYSDKWLFDISKQNLLPYLEAGLQRHPQVLDWFNTKRRRAFAALFTEVTCILRTTRRCNLTEDDRNYIRECCAALEAVGFDASWLSHVSGCIESCGDGDKLMRKLEEAEAKACNLRNELASVEASLVSFRDEASRLHNFIEE